VENRKIEVVRFADLPEPEPIDTTQAVPDDEVTWELIIKVFMASLLS